MLNIIYTPSIAHYIFNILSMIHVNILFYTGMIPIAKPDCRLHGSGAWAVRRAMGHPRPKRTNCIPSGSGPARQ